MSKALSVLTSKPKDGIKNFRSFKKMFKYVDEKLESKMTTEIGMLIPTEGLMNEPVFFMELSKFETKWNPSKHDIINIEGKYLGMGFSGFAGKQEFSDESLSEDTITFEIPDFEPNSSRQ